MYKRITIILLLLIGFSSNAAAQEAFQAGEWFKFRVHYGVFNASYATLEVKEARLKNENVYHVVGKGKSTGLLHLFFKVDDTYETYINKEDGLPYRFIRNIYEGGYTKDLRMDFDQRMNKVYVRDNKKNEDYVYKTVPQVHDMLSVFYHVRNRLNEETPRVGQEYVLDMFYGDETTPFKIRYLGKEVVNTKFGKIATLKFRPYVMAGRVFQEKESLTFWISDDKNKIPVKIKANLAVGSLEADLDEFKGLKHPFTVIMN